MKILLTGATGYVGKRLLPFLVNEGHEVICSVRNRSRFFPGDEIEDKIQVVEVDFLEPSTFSNIPDGIDAAYYLIHSMASSIGDFSKLEAQTAENFKNYADKAAIEQVIYLSGISNDAKMSKHISSRKNVESILETGEFNLTVLRAGIIVGSGSASFEIIRDLVEKLPVMVTPKWLNTKSQPIAVADVIEHLFKTLGKKETYGGTYDIGGPEVLTYREMLLNYAKVRGLKRYILTLPVMTPRLSSYWLFFVTATSYKLAVNLVNSMKMEIVCRDKKLEQLLGLKPITYVEAIERAFKKIEQNLVASSWKDSLASSRKKDDLSHYVEVPENGCFKDVQKFKTADAEKTLDKIWSIGGKTGWYYGDFLWKIRGFLDKTAGGVGLRRGRTNPDDIHTGDSLDFWRVLYASRNKRRLLLFAEMKLPGEAWLEFKINKEGVLEQTATFRPKGLFGRFYWFSMFPFHVFIFRNMAKRIVGG